MLDAARLEPRLERSSRSDPLGEDEARALLHSSRRVIVCRGRKAIELDASEAGTSDLKGPTGNFRAPLLQLGDTLLVGFNVATLSELVS